jgi:rhamnose utilization protein RhaD (predicted bifunctional aldolase and dehydrogenase)/NAD(P)-dependent dehydrogenase (short-subunit alcohol dehydrogenase family)
MHSRWNDADARRFVDRLGAHGEDLALRVYSSRLLGAEPLLVLHGGGNTSVKSTVRDLYGDAVEVLFVKGSGWDLASIEPAGFPACRLEPLRRACKLEQLSDEAMVAELRRQLMDPSSPTPSVEALLHAYLPAKFVDHTHADAVLALLDQPGSEAVARRVFGGDVLFVPYVMPGFVLARRVAQLWDDFTARHRAEPSAILLDKHGVLTWGATAKESYERMIALVTRAERALDARWPSAEPAAEELGRDHRALALALRGALWRASQRGWVACWRAGAEMVRFSERGDLREVTARGTVTPDHVIRTKPRPLVLDAHAGGDPQELGRAADAALAAYARTYEAYFARHATGRSLSRLDPWPRVVVAPGLGVVCLGATIDDARVDADVYEHTVAVVDAAERSGRYEPVSEADLFDVEYWSLEQAKLKRKADAGGALEGRVALVTGAASGIGLATAKAMLAAGAHVMLTDRDERVLEAVSEQPTARWGSRFATRRCDVTVEQECRHAVDAAVDAFGGVDVLVSNAGTAPSGLLHQGAGEHALVGSLEVNLLGHQRIARAAATAMLAQGAGGVLLFNASKAAFNPGPEFGPYAVPKAALVALMRQYAIDLGRHGIRANAVNADRVRTRLFDEGVLEERARARGLSPSAYFRANLLGRETAAEDVAAAFVYLATAEATTGAVLTVDGGNPAAFPR